MSEEVRLLTVRQPYALAIAAGHKTVENRGQNTTWRGLLLVHAGAAWSREGGADQRVMRAFGLVTRDELEFNVQVLLAEEAADDYRPPAAGLPGHYRHSRVVDGRPYRDLMPFGVVVAVARITDSHRVSACCRPWGDPFYAGKPAWHWTLGDVRQLAVPVPALGGQGLRKVPAGLAAQCLEAAG